MTSYAIMFLHFLVFQAGSQVITFDRSCSDICFPTTEDDLHSFDLTTLKHRFVICKTKERKGYSIFIFFWSHFLAFVKKIKNLFFHHLSTVVHFLILVTIL